MHLRFSLLILLLTTCGLKINADVTSSADSENIVVLRNSNSSVSENDEVTVSMVTTKKPKTKLKIRCSYYGVKRSHIPIRKYELKCCDAVWEKYLTKWHNGGRYLTSIMETMHAWNCTQLHDECKSPTFDLTPFTKLVYDKFCGPQKYHKECKGIVKKTYEKQNIGNETENWEIMTYNLRSSKMNERELRNPCLQVAMFESRLSGVGYYHETIDIVPFCGFVWCGFDSTSVGKGGISSWMCIPDRCRVGIIISIVICVLLALLITLANITVILVFVVNKNMRNSQAIYKISLALADLLVGAIVFPTFISTIDKMFLTDHQMGDAVNNYESNPLIIEAMNNTGKTIGPSKPTGAFSDRLSQPYLNFVGVFTTLSLTVSIYTLMMASIDRLLAVSMPMTYSRHNAKNMALWTTIVLWVVGALFSILPLFISDLRYGLVASILVSSSGKRAIILFSIAFIIPLILVWITTIATFLSTQNHAQRRRRLTVYSRRKKGKESLETRLAKTLAIMVGVFTLTLLPAASVLLTSIFLTSIDYENILSFDKVASAAYISAEFVFVLVLMTNSLWNCFIYSARSDDFKIAARGVYRRMLIRLGLASVWNKTRLLASSRRSTSASLSTMGYRKRSTIATLQTNFQSESTDVLDKSERGRRLSSANSRSNIFDSNAPKLYRNTEITRDNNSTIEMK